MKTKTTITEITHDDIVNLLSTGLYGSQFLGVDYSIEDYRKIPNPDEYDCTEDKCAKLLLNGKSIVIYNETMDYTITLSDIKKGLEKALDNGGWDAKCAFDLINDDSCNLDLTEAENLLQIITFGEAIYG